MSRKEKEIVMEREMNQKEDRTKRKAKAKYDMIASIEIAEGKKVILSKRQNYPGYTIAQTVSIEDNGSQFDVFLKNAIHVEDTDILRELGIMLINSAELEEKNRQMKHEESKKRMQEVIDDVWDEN